MPNHRTLVHLSVLAAILAFLTYHYHPFILYFNSSVQNSTFISNPFASDSSPTFTRACEGLSFCPVSCQYDNLEVTVRKTSPEVQGLLGGATKSHRAQLRILQHANKIEPASPSVLTALGAYYETNGELTKAWSHYTRAFRLNSTEAENRIQSIHKNITQLLDHYSSSLEEAKAGLGSSNGLRLATPQRSRDSYVYYTMKLEGSSVTLSSVRDILSTTTKPNMYRDMSWEAREVIGAGEAFDFVFSAFDTKNITEDSIKKIHRKLMEGTDPEHAGRYRDHQVFVRGRRAPGHEDITFLIQKLLTHWASPKFRSLSALLQAITAHVEFVWLHPFADGNGRTSRFLASALLYAHGYPICDIGELDSEQYLDAVADAMPSNGANIVPLVEVYAQCVMRAIRESGQP